MCSREMEKRVIEHNSNPQPELFARAKVKELGLGKMPHRNSDLCYTLEIHSFIYLFIF